MDPGVPSGAMPSLINDLVEALKETRNASKALRAACLAAEALSREYRGPSPAIVAAPAERERAGINHRIWQPRGDDLLVSSNDRIWQPTGDYLLIQDRNDRAIMMPRVPAPLPPPVESIDSNLTSRPQSNHGDHVVTSRCRTSAARQGNALASTIRKCKKWRGAKPKGESPKRMFFFRCKRNIRRKQGGIRWGGWWKHLCFKCFHHDGVRKAECDEHGYTEMSSMDWVPHWLFRAYYTG